MKNGEQENGKTKQEAMPKVCGFSGKTPTAPSTQHSREEPQDAFFSVNRGEGA